MNVAARLRKQQQMTMSHKSVDLHLANAALLMTFLMKVFLYA